LYLPTSGNIIVFGEDITQNKTFPKKTRAVIDAPQFLDFKSGLKNLEYLALLSGNVDKAKIEQSLELVNLEKPAWKKKVKHYSMGMKQKLALAQILMDDPEFIILDEPFNGLDENSVNKTREIIKNLQKK
jgi:ABC-2 type transport system ATP-binding protein